MITATDFKPLSFAEAVGLARRVDVVQVHDWLEFHNQDRALLFDDCRADCGEVAIVDDEAAVPHTLWVVGDVHADVLALANLIAYAERVGEREDDPPAYLFLGDFVDRGHHDHDTLLLLLGLVMRHPERVCVVPGNHDVDLRWGDQERRFGVTLHPAEYCDRLNRLLDGGAGEEHEEVELARLAARFWQTRPKAVFLPDGTMFAHGGFPHTDLHDSLRTRGDLGGKQCVDDFLWARLSESPEKRPNRGNRGHAFGSRDFARFRSVMADVVRVPVHRLVRGHDHVAVRWHVPENPDEFPVLTINAMGRRLDGEAFAADGAHPFPVIARHTPGSLPRVVRVPLDPAEVELAARKPPAAVDADEGELMIAEEFDPAKLEPPPPAPPAGPPGDDAVGAFLDSFPGGPLVEPPVPLPPQAKVKPGGGI